MNAKFEVISRFSQVVNDMTEAISELDGNDITVNDVRSVLSVLDPDVVTKMDNIANLMMPVTSIITEINIPTITSVEATPNEDNGIQQTTVADTYDIDAICRAMIECGFGYQSTLDYCAANGIKVTKYVLSNIRNKSKWTDITDNYFTKDGREFILVEGAVTKTTEVEKEEDVPILGIVMPSADVTAYIKGTLDSERGSIRRAFDVVNAKNHDITIFDVFNVKYDAEARRQPIKTDDISVVVRSIAPTYNYDIPAISRVMRDKCDIIIDATQFHVIRKLARKNGCVAREGGSPVVRRPSDMSDDDDKIAHVLKRLELHTLQTFLHFRATPYPVTILDCFKVKRKIATVTDNDVRVICVNLQRSAGIVKPSEIMDILNKELGVTITREEIIQYNQDYDDYKRLQANTAVS